MRIYAVCVYLFLYTPIAIIALFSFNAGRHASQLQGFSTQWYGRALKNPFVMDALETSLIVAFVSATLASIFGTLAAVGLQGIRGPARAVFDGIIYIAVMIPGIVIGIATLIALVTVFGVVNPWLASLWPEGTDPLSLSMGIGSLIAAHTMFTMALVIIIVRARLGTLEQARRSTEPNVSLWVRPLRADPIEDVLRPHVEPSHVHVGIA
ncbi:MAG: ABC transporter permease, partial [Paracoccaceae bacterium]